MQEPTLTTLEAFEPIFDELWLALGPKERTDYSQRCAVYHRALRGIRAASIREGVDRCIRASRMRALPAPGEIRARALEHVTELAAAFNAAATRDLEPPPATHCACRCGGRRWHRVLRDQEGAVRRHGALTDAMPLAADRRVRTALEVFQGEPMLRTHVCCRRNPRAVIDAEPSHGYVGLHEDGCPVYDPDAPGQAVAA